MKFEITEKGVYDDQGKRVPVGTVVELDGEELPAALKNKGRVFATAAVAVTNPAEGALQHSVQSGTDRQALLKAAAVQIGADGFLEDGRPDVRAINAELTDAAAPFTAAERDQLWPAVADAVKTEREAS